MLRQKKAPRERRLCESCRRSGGACHRAKRSARIVHVELDRMRRHFETRDFGHLQLDIAVDEIIVEHPAGLEKRAIVVEILQSLAKRSADRRDRLQLFLRKIVEIL